MCGSVCACVPCLCLGIFQKFLQVQDQLFFFGEGPPAAPPFHSARCGWLRPGRKAARGRDVPPARGRLGPGQRSPAPRRRSAGGTRKPSRCRVPGGGPRAPFHFSSGKTHPRGRREGSAFPLEPRPTSCRPGGGGLRRRSRRRRPGRW